MKQFFTVPLETKIIGGLILGASLLPYSYLLSNAPPQPEYCYTGKLFMIYIFSKIIVTLIAWCIAFYLAKGKDFRFMILLPIFLNWYQIMTFGLGLEHTFLNFNSTKAIITVGLFSALSLWYFKRRYKLYERR